MVLLNFRSLLLFSFVMMTACHIRSEREKESRDPGFEEQIRSMKGRPEPGMMASILAHQRMVAKTSVQWLSGVTEAGPAHVGGRTRAFAIDSLDHNRYLAGGVSGGIWESTDRGNSWHPVNDQAPTLSVTSISQDPLNPSVWYYASGEPRGNSAGIPGAGLFKSTDNGSTFTQLPSTALPDFDSLWKVMADPIRAGHVYVCTKTAGLMRSTDAGATFTCVLDSGSRDVCDIEIFPDGTLWAAVNGTGIFRSSSGNAGSWSGMRSGLPTAPARRIEMAFCRNAPRTAYAQYEDGSGPAYSSGLLGIWRTTNAGGSWSQVTNPQSQGAAYYFPWYCFTLGVHPMEPDFVMSGCVDLMYTDDGGQNWSYCDYSHADYHCVTFAPDMPDEMIVGNDGGIYRYMKNNAGSTHVPLNHGYNVTQFYAGAFFPQGSSALAGTQDNGTHYWYNGTFNPYEVYGGDGGFAQVSQQDPSISYVSSQSGDISRSQDSQNQYPSYQSIMNQLDGDLDGYPDDGAWFINPFEINSADGDNLYLPTKKRLWRTNDGGNNWIPLTQFVNVGTYEPYAVGISRDPDPVVYLGGEEGIFYRIDHARSAATGTEVNLSASLPASLVPESFINCIRVNPLDPSVLLVCFSNYSNQPRIWKVTQALSANPQWSPVSGNLPAGLPVNSVEFHHQDPDSFWVIGTDLGLYTTSDAGQNWNLETNVPNVSIHQIRLRESDRKLFIFTHGRGMWTADLPMFVPNDVQHDDGIRVYPNPADTWLQVQGISESVEWALYDGGGQLKDSGTWNHNAGGMDVSRFASGIYFLKAGQHVSKIWISHTGASR